MFSSQSFSLIDSLEKAEETIYTFKQIDSVIENEKERKKTTILISGNRFQAVHLMNFK